MSKRHAPIPRVTSKTITVRSLLKKIQRLILDEPKRLNMNDWVAAFGGRNLGWTATDSLPACGTVACMAGWGAILLRPERVPATKLHYNAEEVLQNLVGFTDKWYDRSVGRLFNADYTDYDAPDDDGYSAFPQAGTEEHAVVVVKRIDAYMKAHPEILTRKIDVAAARKALRA